MIKKGSLRMVIGVLISAFFLLLAIRGVNFNQLLGSFAGLKYHYLLFAVLFLFLSLLSRSFLWRCIIGTRKNVKISHLFQIVLIGYMANNVLPARMGELVRAYTLGIREQLSKIFSFGTIIIERLFDLLSLILFAGFVSLFIELPGFISIGIYALGLFLSFMFVFIFFGFKRDVKRLNIVYFIIKRIPERIKSWLEKRLELLWSSFEILKEKKKIIPIFLFSLATWICMVVFIYFGFLAFSLKLPFYAPILLLVILNIGVLIPSSPGFIGVYQYLCVLSLSYFYVGKSQALSFSFVSHAMEYIPVTLLGLFYFTRLNLKLKEFNKGERLL